MDDLKTFEKTEREINRLVSTVQLFSKAIGIEIGIKKCGMFINQKRKVVPPNLNIMKHYLL